MSMCEEETKAFITAMTNCSIKKEIVEMFLCDKKIGKESTEFYDATDYSTRNTLYDSLDVWCASSKFQKEKSNATNN